MPDTFPALRADAARLRRDAKALADLADTLIADALAGDAAAVRALCQDIGKAGERLEDLTSAFALTSDHFVTYDDAAEA